MHCAWTWKIEAATKREAMIATVAELIIIDVDWCLYVLKCAVYKYAIRRHWKSRPLVFVRFLVSYFHQRDKRCRFRERFAKLLKPTKQGKVRPQKRLARAAVKAKRLLPSKVQLCFYLVLTRAVMGQLSKRLMLVAPGKLASCSSGEDGFFSGDQARLQAPRGSDL